jgi:hypothetical protein
MKSRGLAHAQGDAVNTPEGQERLIAGVSGETP